MAASTSSSDAGKKFFICSSVGFTMRREMYQFYKEGKFVDCALTASDTKSFRCHRVVLAAASPILCEALSQPKSSFACVILFDVSSSDLGLLVELIYRGKVQVPEDRIEEFKKAGEKLKICSFGKYEKFDDAPSPSLQDPVLVGTTGTSEPELMDEPPAPSKSPIFPTSSKSPNYVELKIVLQQLKVEEHLAQIQQPARKSPIKVARRRLTYVGNPPFRRRGRRSEPLEVKSINR